VPADLPPDESRKLALVMLRLHAEFRQRHGLPPVPGVWTLLEDVEEVKRRASLSDAAVLRSPRAVIGPLVTFARWFLWKLLKPVFDRQTDVNRSVLTAVETVARDREQRRHADFDVSLRLNDLERWREDREGGS
jgi:hypothetical protein